jgi:SAM-dependent methyltransferase
MSSHGLVSALEPSDLSASGPVGSVQQRTAMYNEVLDRLDDLVALESLRSLGVFHRLLEGPLPLGQLVQGGESPARLRPFLDLVVQLGFLQRKGETYSLVPGDEAMFQDPCGLGCGDLLLYLKRRGSAVEVLRSDQPLESGSTGGSVTQEMRTHFLSHVHSLSGDVAEEVASLLSDRSIRRIADLGCGPGTYTVSLLQRFREAEAVMVDRPNTAAYVQALCEAEGVGDRASFWAADILEEDYGSGYDLILLSEVIHNFGPPANRALLEGIARRLAPGGIVAIKDDDSRGSLRNLRFGVALAIFSSNGGLYSESEVLGWLESSGLRHLESTHLKTSPGKYLILAEKP